MVKLLKNNTSGFTLQELLVTMMIISILSLVGYSSFHSIQVKGRDQKRKQDIHSLVTALNLYYKLNRRYPCTGDNVWEWSTSGGTWIQDTDHSNCGSAAAIDLDSDYISANPIDPINNGNPVWVGKFVYGYRDGWVSGLGCPQSNEGQYFVVAALLENKNDMDNNQDPTECNGSTIPWSTTYPSLAIYSISSTDSR